MMSAWEFDTVRSMNENYRSVKLSQVSPFPPAPRTLLTPVAFAASTRRPQPRCALVLACQRALHRIPHRRHRRDLRPRPSAPTSLSYRQLSQATSRSRERTRESQEHLAGSTRHQRDRRSSWRRRHRVRRLAALAEVCTLISSSSTGWTRFAPSSASTL